ncbi:MAG: hypothetical protein ACRDU9_08660 [Acidimicrobiia bacterium]
MLETPLPDQIVEALFARQELDDPAFQGLSSILAELDLERLDVRVDDRAEAFAFRAAAMVEAAAASPRALPHRQRRALTPRLATAALAVVAVMGITGVAAASNSSAPGDLLYGLDRAFERIGVNDGGFGERVDEAKDLTGEGSAPQALNHLAEVLRPSSPSAADALHAAADKLGQADTPKEVTDDVASMLEWIASSDVSGKDFGQGVAERARGLGRAGGVVAPADSDDLGPGNGDGSGNGGDSGGKGKGPPGGTPPGQRGP